VFGATQSEPQKNKPNNNGNSIPSDVTFYIFSSHLLCTLDSNIPMRKYPPFLVVKSNETFYLCCVCSDYLSASQFQQGNIRSKIKYCRQCNISRVLKYRKNNCKPSFRVFMNSHPWDRTRHGSSRNSLLSPAIVETLCSDVFKWKSALSGRRTKQMILIRLDSTSPLSAWNCILIHTREAKLLKSLSPAKRHELVQSVGDKVSALPEFQEQRQLFDLSRTSSLTTTPS
jgi:hypothetical protein